MDALRLILDRRLQLLLRCDGLLRVVHEVFHKIKILLLLVLGHHGWVERKLEHLLIIGNDCVLLSLLLSVIEAELGAAV